MTLKSIFKNTVYGAVSALAVPLVGVATAQAEEKSALDEAIAGSKPIFNVRLRSETVDQDGFAEDADALTYRIRAGFESGALWDTKLLVDFEHVEDVIGDFNSTINGKTMFPVVADPNVTELNRLQLKNTSLPDTTITLGRQRIILDNARFVGNVGWRQNEQTFDAVRLENTSIKGLKLDFTYIDQVNRIFGDDSPMGRWESDSYLVNAKYKLPTNGPKVTLGGFAYLLDFDNAAAASSQTYGVDAAVSAGPFTLKGAYANQSDYGNQPVSYDADYYLVEGGVKKSGWSGAVGYEVLTGDGTKAFATPLATLHAFNGWADVFLGTPANGLEDLYAKVGYTTKKVEPFDLLKFSVVYHDFSAENITADYGTEVDFVAVAKINKFKVLLKYASYDTDGFATDRNKLWAQVEFAY